MFEPTPQTALTPDDRASVAAILGCYARGWFPMHDPDRGLTEWVRPPLRAILPLDARFIVSRSLWAVVRSGRFRLTCDQAFGEVIRACAGETRQPEGTWIGPDIIEAFELLRRAGYAHSVEAWVEVDGAPQLVGGLYGLALGSIFCGESMFSRPHLGGSNASKVALVHLVNHLRTRGFTLIDAQIENPHLLQFGCYEIPDREYRGLLRIAAADARDWGQWAPELHPPHAQTLTCSSPPPPPPCTATQSPRR